MPANPKFLRKFLTRNETPCHVDPSEMNSNALSTPCDSHHRRRRNGLNLTPRNAAVEARIQKRQIAREISTEIRARRNGVSLNPGPLSGSALDVFIEGL